MKKIRFFATLTLGICLTSGSFAQDFTATPDQWGGVMTWNSQVQQYEYTYCNKMTKVTYNPNAPQYTTLSSRTYPIGSLYQDAAPTEITDKLDIGAEVKTTVLSQIAGELSLGGEISAGEQGKTQLKGNAGIKISGSTANTAERINKLANAIEFKVKIGRYGSGLGRILRWGLTGGLGGMYCWKTRFTNGIWKPYIFAPVAGYTSDGTYVWNETATNGEISHSWAWKHNAFYADGGMGWFPTSFGYSNISPIVCVQNFSESQKNTVSLTLFKMVGTDSENYLPTKWFVHKDNLGTAYSSENYIINGNPHLLQPFFISFTGTSKSGQYEINSGMISFTYSNNRWVCNGGTVSWVRWNSSYSAVNGSGTTVIPGGLLSSSPTWGQQGPYSGNPFVLKAY